VQQRHRGTVQQWNDTYGFIAADDPKAGRYGRVFFHRSALWGITFSRPTTEWHSTLLPTVAVRFEVDKAPAGLFKTPTYGDQLDEERQQLEADYARERGS
jgi:cold shock CspA family protein